MSCFCDFCGKIQTPVGAICEWCHITIYGYIDNPDDFLEILQKSQTMFLLIVRLCGKLGSHNLNI